VLFRSAGNGPATLNWSNVTATGYTKPLNLTGTTGTLTITLAAGQDQPEYDTAGIAVAWNQAASQARARLDWSEDGSTVEIYIVDTSTQVYSAVVTGSTTWSEDYVDGTTFDAGQTVRVRVRKPGFDPIERTATVTDTGWGITATQFSDEHYSGLTPANYTIDYANAKIRATGARASFSAQELADIIRQAEATEEGIELPEFAAISGLVELSPGVATALTVDLIDWQVSWAAASVAQATIDGGNVVGGLAGDVVEDVVGGPQVTVRVSAAATQVTAGGSIPTAEQNAAAVWGYLIRTLTSVGGATLAEIEASTVLAKEATSAAIKAKTDALPSDPADQSAIEAAISAIPSAPSAAANAAAVRSELATELARIDAATSSRATPANVPSAATTATAVRAELAAELADVVAIDARLPADPADQSAVEAAIAALPAPLDAPATQAAAAAAIAAYAPATSADVPAPAAVADALLARNLAGGTDGGRTVRDALRASRNRVAIDGTTLTVYQEDDATAAWSAALSLATRKPIMQVDPT